ncbi:hypothetical protein [Fibrobacter sp. UBA4297]|uniref:hypothetical protein n=1 Tax=Fibrobacter sp. UBA4297 TaxID=1946536 RepID=UPI0025C3C301|nr:hypothetical protein [Fibrobacter sp. UBA4297]
MATKLKKAGKISVNDLLPGDILAFKGDPDDDISKLIMKFTGSDVSHGAIFVQKQDNVLAEAGGDGIHARRMKDNSNAREAYVMRHNKARKYGVEPVVPIAKDYVLQDLPYPYSDLILLGLILIFKHQVTNQLLSRVVVEFLCLVAAELKTIIEKEKTPGKHTMVCSSYVYQCYLDASKKNPALKLKLKDADVGFKDHPLIGRKSKSKSVTLFDMYANYVETHEEECKKNFKLRKSVAPKKLRSKEEILADLKKLLLSKISDKIPTMTPEQFSTVIDIIEAIKDVISALATFFKGDRVSFSEMMKIAREQQAMFVTPSDLVNHVTNVTLVGMLRVERYGEDYDENWK